ncbi:MAG: type II secretion system inner membrane protein GspF [Pseudomonadota bacterium]|nr:type II secretion system inner membrane protein GspF [Pseudomonadota bacterium]
MAVYEYVGLDGAGKSTKGIVDADSAKTARGRLRKQGVFPTEVWEKKEGATRGKGSNVEIDFGKYFQRISVQDLATLTSQLSTLIGAGIPMVEALTALVDQTENPKLKGVLVEVRQKVNGGTSLARALRAHPEVFGELFVNMVDAGEQSGALDLVLTRLTQYTEGQVALRGKLVAAVTYPILMMVVSGALVLGLFTFVIPRIKRIFDSFGEGLPLITTVLFTVSNIVTGYWWLIAIVMSLGAWGLRRYVRTPKGSLWWDRMSLKMPVFGKINRLVAVSRFCRTLATLLVSGVPILTALTIVRTVVGNEVIAAAIDGAARNIAEGQSIAVPLKASGQFPPIVTHMITIGEKTGELEGMLGKVADSYDSQVENTVNTLTSLLTPILTLFMGVVVATIALGILLPMLSLSSVVR